MVFLPLLVWVSRLSPSSVETTPEKRSSRSAFPRGWDVGFIGGGKSRPPSESTLLRPIAPWAGQGPPAPVTHTPILLPGKSHGRRSLVGCSPWGGKESDTTERLITHAHSIQQPGTNLVTSPPAANPPVAPYCPWAGGQILPHCVLRPCPPLHPCFASTPFLALSVMLDWPLVSLDPPSTLLPLLQGLCTCLSSAWNTLTSSPPKKALTD